MCGDVFACMCVHIVHLCMSVCTGVPVRMDPYMCASNVTNTFLKLVAV